MRGQQSKPSTRPQVEVTLPDGTHIRVQEGMRATVITHVAGSATETTIEVE